MDRHLVYVLLCSAPGCRSKLALAVGLPIDMTRLDPELYQHKRIVELITRSDWSWTQMGLVGIDTFRLTSSVGEWIGLCGNHNSGRVEVDTIQGKRTSDG